MTREDAFIYIIFALLVVLAYLMRQVQKLVDKLMSRNYTEYVQTNELKKQHETPKSVETAPVDTDINVMGSF